MRHTIAVKSILENEIRSWCTVLTYWRYFSKYFFCDWVDPSLLVPIKFINFNRTNKWCSIKYMCIVSFLCHCNLIITHCWCMKISASGRIADICILGI